MAITSFCLNRQDHFHSLLINCSAVNSGDAFPTSDRRQSKTIFDKRSSIVKSFFDCRLSGVFPIHVPKNWTLSLCGERFVYIDVFPYQSTIFQSVVFLN